MHSQLLPLLTESTLHQFEAIFIPQGLECLSEALPTALTWLRSEFVKSVLEFLGYLLTFFCDFLKCFFGRCRPVPGRNMAERLVDAAAQVLEALSYYVELLMLDEVPTRELLCSS